KFSAIKRAVPNCLFQTAGEQAYGEGWMLTDCLILAAERVVSSHVLGRAGCHGYQVGSDHLRAQRKIECQHGEEASSGGTWGGQRESIVGRGASRIAVL